MHEYVDRLIELVTQRLAKLEYSTEVPLGFAESRIELYRRTPVSYTHLTLPTSDLV